MDVTVDKQDDQIVVTVVGEVDADNCATFGQRLLADDAADTGLPMVLDLSALRFIDSSGISELLRVREAMIAGGGSVRIDASSPAVQRVLQITGLLDAFGLAPADD